MLRRLLFYGALLIAVLIPLMMVQEGPIQFPHKKRPQKLAPQAGHGGHAPGSLDLTAADLDETAAEAEAFLVPAVEEDNAVLDSALQRIFPAARPAPDEAAAIEILRYVPQVTRLKFLNAQRGSDCLAQGFSFGTGMAQAFVALCQRIGLPARVNAFHNFEYMQGYNGAEVYYAGAWHFFDPTYAVFFYSEAEYTGQGKIPGLRDLLSVAGAHEHGFMASAPEALWGGAYDRNAGLRALARDFHYGDYDFNLGQLYDQVFRSSFPVAYNTRDTAVFPLDGDLSEEDGLWLGGLNEDSMDIFGKNEAKRYQRYRGAPQTGSTRLGGTAILVTLKVRAPGRYRITYHMLPDSRLDNMSVTELKSVVAIRVLAEATTWALELYVQAREGQVLISNPGRRASIDAVHLERLPEVPQ